MKNSFASLYREFPAATGLYLHLLELAAQRCSLRLLTTRAQLAEPLGLQKLNVITNALKALQTFKLIRFKVRCRTDSGGKVLTKYHEITLRKSGLTIIGQKSFKGLMDINTSQSKSPFKGLWIQSPHRAQVPKRVTLHSSGADGVATAPPPPLTEAEAAAIFTPKPERTVSCETR